MLSYGERYGYEQLHKQIRTVSTDIDQLDQQIYVKQLYQAIYGNHMNKYINRYGYAQYEPIYINYIKGYIQNNLSAVSTDICQIHEHLHK